MKTKAWELETDSNCVIFNHLYKTHVLYVHFTFVGRVWEKFKVGEFEIRIEFGEKLYKGKPQWCEREGYIHWWWCTYIFTDFGVFPVKMPNKVDKICVWFIGIFSTSVS